MLLLLLLCIHVSVVHHVAIAQVTCDSIIVHRLPVDVLKPNLCSVFASENVAGEGARGCDRRFRGPSVIVVGAACCTHGSATRSWRLIACSLFAAFRGRERWRSPRSGAVAHVVTSLVALGQGMPGKECGSEQSGSRGGVACASNICHLTRLLTSWQLTPVNLMPCRSPSVGHLPSA